MEICVSRKLKAERYSRKYSAMNPMGWRANQLRFMGKSLLFATGQTLSIQRLYAHVVAKTRRKGDNFVKKRTIYL